MSFDFIKLKEVSTGLEKKQNIDSKPLQPKMPQIKFEASEKTIDPNSLKKNELKSLLEKYGEDSSRKNRKNIQSIEYDSNKSSLIINYKDSKKIINEDLSYDKIFKATNESTKKEETVTQSYSRDNILVKEKIDGENFIIEKFFDNKKKTKSVSTDKNSGETVTLLFDENENPAKKVIKSGSTVMDFDFSGEGGSERITSKTTNKGLAIESTQYFSYTSCGDVKITTEQSSGSEPKILSSGTSIGSENESNVNNSSKTVLYASSSNFDSKTGTVVDKSKLSNKPINTQSNTSEKSDESSKDMSTASTQSSEHVSEKYTSEATNYEADTTQSVNANNSSKQDSVDTNVSKPAETSELESNYTSTTEATQSYETKSQNQENNNVANSQEVKSKDSQIITAGINKSNESVGTEQYQSKKNEYNGIKLNENLKQEDTIKLPADIDNIVKQEVKSINRLLEKYIVQYSKDNNIPVSEVKKLFGFSENVKTEEYLNFVTKKLSTNNVVSVSNIINELKNQLTRESGNLEKIKNTISSLATVTHNSSTVTDDKSEKLEPQIINNISEYASKIGVKAAALYEKLNTIKPGEKTHATFDVKSGSTSIEKKFIIEITKNGEIIFTEIKSSIKSNAQEQDTERNYIAELAQYVSPELKIKLQKCSTAKECQNILNDFMSKRLHAEAKSIKLNITNNDLRYKSIYKDGILYKVPINTKLPQENNAAEEVHLNVKADNELLKELHELFKSGKYKNRVGKTSKIKPQNVTIVTPKSVEDWINTKEPVTIYFEKNVDKETEEVIQEITRKYSRKKAETKDSEQLAENNSNNQQVYAEKEERIRDILINLGIPNAQVTAFAASMAYISSDGYRKVIKNGNDTTVRNSDTVKLNDDIS